MKQIIQFAARWFRNNWWILILVLILLICLLATGASLLYYNSNFSAFKLSDDPQDWGVFGDYVGGTLNPLLGIMNICITIWIAIILNRISKTTNEKQLASHRTITLMQFKYDAVKDLRVLLNDRFLKWSVSLKDKSRVSECIKALEDFEVTYGKLFEIKEMNSYKALRKGLQEAESKIKEDEIMMRKRFEFVETHKLALLYEMGNYIIEKQN